MSGFIGGTGNNTILAADDQRHVDDAFFGPNYIGWPPVLLWPIWEDDLEQAGYATPWWPPSSRLIGGMGFGGDDLLVAARPVESIWTATGAVTRWTFRGTTRDQYGVALGACVVRLYRALTGEFVASVTSNDDGTYYLATPFYAAHFLTVHKAGSPGVAGATVDTATPS